MEKQGSSPGLGCGDGFGEVLGTRGSGVVGAGVVGCVGGEVGGGAGVVAGAATLGLLMFIVTAISYPPLRVQAL